MAREISSRILVSGTLVASSPIHVGGTGYDPEIDLALAVDGQGRFYVPGTSLAGALRAWMSAVGDKKTIDLLWGALLSGGQPNHASYILVEDAPIEDAVSEVRDGVGIDRILGTAAERVKYNQAILPRGTRIPLEMTVELQDTSEAVLALLKDTLTSLKERKLRLGASKTRGMGRVELQNLSISQQSLNTTTGMLQALRQQGTGITLTALSSQPLPKQRSNMALNIFWRPVSSLMVKAEADGIAVDHLPLTSAVENENIAFVLPGSSIKGVLRTQAERIVRTVNQLPTPDDNDLSQRFMNQLEQNHLITGLFGRAANVERNGKTKQLGCIGALAADDCYAQAELNPEVWSKITSATTSQELYEQLQIPLPETQQAFHVAIDRWTGGAADGLLYSTLEPMGIAWEPIRLTLDLDQIERNLEGKVENSQAVALTLLLLVLRDLVAGRISLGYGTNRGMGAITVEQIEVEGSGLPEAWSILSDLTLHQDDFQTADSPLMPLLRSLQPAWSNWIGQSHNMDSAEITA